MQMAGARLVMAMSPYPLTPVTIRYASRGKPARYLLLLRSLALR